MQYIQYMMLAGMHQHSPLWILPSFPIPSHFILSHFINPGGNVEYTVKDQVVRTPGGQVSGVI